MTTCITQENGTCEQLMRLPVSYKMVHIYEQLNVTICITHEDGTHLPLGNIKDGCTQ